MTAINVVRFRVRPGMDDVFLNAHPTARPTGHGSTAASSSQPVTAVMSWSANGRTPARSPARAERMIANLNSFRHVLEDLDRDLASPMRSPAVSCCR